VLCGLQVAVALSRTKESAVTAHARDELGIDLDDLANPFQVSMQCMPKSPDLDCTFNRPYCLQYQ
jgi:hypothetical protein